MKPENNSDLQNSLSKEEICQLIKLSSQNGSTELVKKLVEFINLSDLNSQQEKLISRSVFVACENGYTEILKLLISHGAKVYEKHFREAAENKRFDIVKILVEEPSFNFEKMYWYPLEMAIKDNDFQMVQYMIEKGADPCFNQAIIDAVSYASESIIQLLLDSGVKSNVQQLNKALICATKQNKIEVVEKLIKNGADITFNNFEALYVALNECNYDILSFFIRTGDHSVFNHSRILKIYNEYVEYLKEVGYVRLDQRWEKSRYIDSRVRSYNDELHRVVYDAKNNR